MDPEQLADIQAEYVIYIAMDRRDIPGKSELIEQNPLWEHVPAVHNGHILGGQVSQWIAGGPLAISVCINDMVKAFLPENQRSAALQRMLKERPTDEDLADVAHWPADRGVTPPAPERGPREDRPGGRMPGQTAAGNPEHRAEK